MIRSDVDDLICFLNEVCNTDAEALSELISFRVSCSDTLANHESVQCCSKGKFGLLGLLNGYAGVLDSGAKAGYGPIQAMFDSQGNLSGFERLCEDA